MSRHNEAQEVARDIMNYIDSKYNLESKSRGLKPIKAAYSGNFDFNRFVANISDKKAMVLFTMICKKLGVGFIQDSQGWKIACLEETADELMEFIKKYVPSAQVDTVVQPE